MLRAFQIVARLWRDTRAATAIEYGLILALVFLALVSGVTMLGNITGTMWDDVNTKVANAH